MITRCSAFVSIPVFALVAAGCAQERDQALQEDLQERSALIEEVKEQIDAIDKGDYARALAGLKHRHHRVREKAVKRLLQLKTRGSQTVDALIEALKDESERVRIAAARTLGEIGDKRAIEHLLYVLADADPAVRLWAGKAVKKLGNEAIIALIGSLAFASPYVDVQFEDLDGKKVPVRRVAKELLASMGKQAVPLLIEALKNEKDEGILHNIPGVLGKMGADAKDALPALIAAFDTPDVQMRVNVVSDIGKIGDLHPDVMRTLQKASADPDKKVQRAARRSMRLIDKSPTKHRTSRKE